MFFAWLCLSFLVFKFLPWWGIALMGFIAGFARPGSIRLDALLAAVTSVVGVAMAFFMDGKNFGYISLRMSGLFGLPVSEMIFAVQSALIFVTVILALQAGGVFRSLLVALRKN